nr:MAG TPA_asm: hypothetical protein [Caudoviricetes sp.]
MADLSGSVSDRMPAAVPPPCRRRPPFLPR